MQFISASQAKISFSALLDQVEKGEQIIITKYGYPIAKLVRVTIANHARMKKAIQRLKEFAQLNKLDSLNWKEFRDEGHR